MKIKGASASASLSFLSNSALNLMSGSGQAHICARRGGKHGGPRVSMSTQGDKYGLEK